MNLSWLRVGRREKLRHFGASSNDNFARQGYNWDSVQRVREKPRNMCLHSPSILHCFQLFSCDVLKDKILLCCGLARLVFVLRFFVSHFSTHEAFVIRDRIIIIVMKPPKDEMLP